MIMEKKVYMQPSLKAVEMDEALLAGVSGEIEGESGSGSGPTFSDGGEGDGSDAAGRIHYSVWDEDEE